MKFTKAQTNGNDFVIINGNGEGFSSSQKRLIADRKFGIGCDQIVFVKKQGDHFLLNFFNQDGSHADMCGNGSCASILYIKNEYGVENVSLEISKRIYNTKISENEVTVSFPIPGRSGDVVLTGNKHLILKMSDIDRVTEIAESNPNCNLHFVEKISENSLRIRTFERGVGWTLACGSGAIATGFHSEIKGKIKIIHDRGESIVEVFKNHVNLTTTPKLVFEGEFYF